MRTLTILALSAMTLAACGDKEDDTASAADDTGAVDADLATAEALWTEISGYDSWGQITDWEGVVASDDGTHGSHVQIWVNGDAESTITAAAGGVMPDGAIIVKEGYSDEAGAELGAITVMKKDSTYGSTGWFWARYSADGTPTSGVYGEPDGCTGCHSGGQDYVLFTTW